MSYGGLNFFISLKPKSKSVKATSLQNDEHLIFVDCNAGRTHRTKVFTGIKVYRKDWDPVKKSIRRTDPEYALKNRTILQILEFSKTIAVNLMGPGQTRDQRIQAWKKEVVAFLRPLPETPIESFDPEKELFKVLDRQGNQLQDSTRQVYRTAITYLKTFCSTSNRSANPATFSSDFLSAFLSFLYKEGNVTDNSAHKIIRTLQTGIRKIIKTDSFKQNGWNVHPDFLEPISIVRKRKVDKVFLTPADLKKIINFNPESTRIQKVKQIFLFQCLTGLRYSDLQSLSKPDIKSMDIDGQQYFYIEKRQVKTQEYVKIPLVPPAYDILVGFDFSLPVPSNQKYNDYLKELASDAGLNEIVKVTRYQGVKEQTENLPKWKLIGSHTARHTTATLGLQLGIPAKVVQATLGHADLKTTMVYSHDDFKFNLKTMVDSFKIT